MVTSFSEDDIIAAKRLLWTLPGKEKLGEWCERKKSPNRSVIEANVNDIIEALQLLDQEGHSLIFTASDLKDLPPHSPEEINSVALLKRIEMLEMKYNSLEGSANQHQIDLCTLSNTQTEQGQTLKTIENTIETHATLINSLQSKTQENPKSDQQEDPKSDQHVISSSSDESETEDDAESESGDDADDEMNRETVPKDDAVQKTNDERKLPSSDVQLTGATSLKGSKANEKSSPRSVPVAKGGRGFRTASQMSGKRKPLKSSYSDVLQRRPLSAAKSNPVRSEAKRPQLLSAYTKGPKADKDGFITPRGQRRGHGNMKKIYIGNVDRKHSIDEVFNFLRSKKMRVTGLYQRSHFSAAKKSFVCLLSTRDFNTLAKDDDCKEFEIREYTDTAPVYN